MEGSMRCPRRKAFSVSPFLLLAIPLVGFCSPPPTAKSPRPADRVLTEENFDQNLRVKKGDVIEVRLVASVPSAWARIDSNELLRPVEGYPRVESVPRIARTISNTYIHVHRYQVTGDVNAPITLKLLYCRGGKPPATGANPDRDQPTPPKFHPNQSLGALREGMIYQVALKTAP
jgi:hypothetical protein